MLWIVICTVHLTVYYYHVTYYRVWVHSKTRTWHNNIQSINILFEIIEYVNNDKFQDFPTPSPFEGHKCLVPWCLELLFLFVFCFCFFVCSTKWNIHDKDKETKWCILNIFFFFFFFLKVLPKDVFRNPIKSLSWNIFVKIVNVF